VQKEDPHHPSTCKAYEEFDEAANSSWKALKKVAKKHDKHTLDIAMNDYCQAVNSVMNIWPRVVEELGIEMTSATETAYLAGYSEAKGI
jgi:hypothetical protein